MFSRYACTSINSASIQVLSFKKTVLCTENVFVRVNCLNTQKVIKGNDMTLTFESSIHYFSLPTTEDAFLKDQPKS